MCPPPLPPPPRSAGLRHMTYSIFFGELVERGTMEACAAAYTLGARWFAFWAGRQQGDVAPDEMAVIADKVVFLVGGGGMVEVGGWVGEAAGGRRAR